MLRTHNCGELRKEHVDNEVTLYGWARNIRDHKDIFFINLTDRYGWTQVCATREQVGELPRESFIKIRGKVIARPEGNINKNVDTGEIEVTCIELEVVSKCKVLPFDIQDTIDAKEEARLKYRFLDMRRPIMLSRLKFRSKVASAIRKTMEDMDFLEVETPMFVRSTPEGSRDFLVPSRTFPGSFYALPQSPQLYKQMLMIAGVDKYYQFARCYRDEDARRERQLVHTQLDIEMALVTEEDVYSSIEKIMVNIYKDVLGKDIEAPFPRYSYDECIRRWGIDKPDLRFGMELIDFTDSVKESGLRFLDDAITNGGVVKGLVAPGCSSYSRKKVTELEKFVQTFEVKGLMSFKVKEGKLEGSLAKKMKPENLEHILKTSEAKDGDLILLCSGKANVIHRGLGELRKLLGKRLELIDEKKICFLWVKEFPIFEWDETEEKWTPMHHMFTMPSEKYIDTMEEKPGEVTGQLYDLVLNGVELGSGSIRITKPEIQKRIMAIIGMSEEEAQKRFGFLMDAYEYASPSHGGIGIGFDNLVMTIMGLENIRDVIAYPNASNGSFLYDGSPSAVEDEQIKELHIKLHLPEEKNQNNTCPDGQHWGIFF